MNWLNWQRGRDATDSNGPIESPEPRICVFCEHEREQARIAREDLRKERNAMLRRFDRMEGEILKLARSLAEKQAQVPPQSIMPFSPFPNPEPDNGDPPQPDPTRWTGRLGRFIAKLEPHVFDATEGYCIRREDEGASHEEIFLELSTGSLK